MFFKKNVNGSKAMKSACFRHRHLRAVPPFRPEFLAHMPAALRNVLESGVATGGICALVLNWFLPGQGEGVKGHS